ncbi:MAG: hypothetical protein QMD50_03765 [Patescibacteria group bacterium]|nr:hypothetical protein [Patescibacteria group bacterium]
MKKKIEEIKNEKVFKSEISWRAAEYDFIQKDVSWYWIVIGVAAALILIAIWQKNVFFAIFIAIATMVVIFFGRRRPQILDFKISEEEIIIGKLHHKFDVFENFSLRKRPGRLDEIVLKKKKTFNPFLKIPIDSTLAQDARVLLLDKLPEVEYSESLVEIFSDWMGF